MTSTPFPDLDTASLIERIAQGEVPRDFVLLIARGFLPIPQEELIEVLLVLARRGDEEIVGVARNTLRELPPRVLLGFARSTSADPQLLDTLADASTDAVVLEAVLRNRVTPDLAVARLATRVSASLQDVVVTNQERIIRHPEILDALLANPSITPDVRRRAMEVRDEFFEKARRAPKPATEDEPELDLLPESELTPEQQAELSQLLEKAREAEEASAPASVPAPEVADEKTESAWRRIQRMTVAQKVQCAFRGGATERSILIRERNKMICSAVIRSPRITDNEVETFAGLRNVDDEVLRIIGSNRGWMSKYSIMLALVRNPKAPLGTVLPLINRLNLKELKMLGTDKNVSEAVRHSARRLYIARKHA